MEGIGKKNFAADGSPGGVCGLRLNMWTCSEVRFPAAFWVGFPFPEGADIVVNVYK